MKDDSYVISKMIRYCDDIMQILDEYDHSYEKYRDCITFQYACNMCIIQIGELVGRLSDDFIDKHSDIPWHQIKAMRNLYAHDYENIKLKIVWDTLTTDIPDLKNRLNAILFD